MIEHENALKYTRNLTLKQSAEGKVISIIQSYPGGPSVSYLLTNKPTTTHSKKQLTIKTPIESMVGTSTSHVGFIDLLDKEQVLKGFTTTDFISSPEINALIDQKEVVDLGRDSDINMEKLLELSPDLVIGYSISGNITQYQQIIELGIPVIYDASYLEPTPLAQAEWIKLIGLMTGKEAQADSIFDAIEQNFLALKDLVIDHSQGLPTIIGGSVYNGTWYMPGGKSWVANYINLAGGDYLWDDILQTGSIPLSFEAVYERSAEADFWIGATAYKNYSQLIAEDDRYLKFKAVMDTSIYSPTKRVTPKGGNDYYESGVARPDLVLKDFIKILQPQLLPDHDLYYYQRMNEVLTNE